LVDAFTIIIEPWQFCTGLITFIIGIVATTFAIARFVYSMKGNVKVLETVLSHYGKDLDRQGEQVSKLLNLFENAGFNLFMKRAEESAKDG
jgi:uncharacterized membrane-anchored protein YhcB (DUF1043 family)